MSKGIVGGIGRALGGLGVDEPKVLMDKQVVFHPQDSDANSIKAKVEIEKNYNGALVKAGISFKGDSLMSALLCEFAGEFMIKVEKEEEVEGARQTLMEFQRFIEEFAIATNEALNMYPEMAKKEEPDPYQDLTKEVLGDLIKQTPKDHFGDFLTQYLDAKTLDELKEMATKKDIDLGNVSDDKETLVFVIAKSSLENWEHELPEGTTDAEAIAEFIIG